MAPRVERLTGFSSDHSAPAPTTRAAARPHRWYSGLTWKGVALVYAFCVLNAIRGHAFGLNDEPWHDILERVAIGSLVDLSAFVPIVLAVVATLNLFPSSGRRQYGALALAVILGAAIGVVFYMGIGLKGNFIDYSDPHPIVHFAKEYQSNFLRFGVLGALFAVMYAYYRNESGDAAALQQVELDRARLDAQMDEARLLVLQAQIEPHFLFNTLAHVRRLYQTEPTVARGMLVDLMRYFTVALPQMRERDSTVERETTLAEAYLNIQRIRMGRRLSFEISLPDSLRHARMPPMMLLTLVENAVKHGLGPLPEGGFIRIDAKADSGSLEVKVADTGGGFTSISGAGTGLANIRARLTAVYGDSGRLSLKPNEPRGVTASIAIPLTIATTQAEPR
jgi:signal transduction histidine kinase